MFRRELYRCLGAFTVAALLLAAVASVRAADPPPAKYSNVPHCNCGCEKTGQCQCKNCCERTADPLWVADDKKPKQGFDPHDPLPDPTVDPRAAAKPKLTDPPAPLNGWLADDPKLSNDYGYYVAGKLTVRYFVATNDYSTFDGTSYGPHFSACPPSRASSVPAGASYGAPSSCGQSRGWFRR